MNLKITFFLSTWAYVFFSFFETIIPFNKYIEIDMTLPCLTVMIAVTVTSVITKLATGEWS